MERNPTLFVSLFVNTGIEADQIRCSMRGVCSLFPHPLWDSSQVNGVNPSQICCSQFSCCICRFLLTTLPWLGPISSGEIFSPLSYPSFGLPHVLAISTSSFCGPISARSSNVLVSIVCSPLHDQRTKEFALSHSGPISCTENRDSRDSSPVTGRGRTTKGKEDRGLGPDRLRTRKPPGKRNSIYFIWVVKYVRLTSDQ